MGSYARDLIREALTDPQQLLRREKFWKVLVFQEFLREITARLYTDIGGAYALAKLGPVYAELVATHDKVDRNILLVRAYGHLGNAYRALGRYADADDAYDRAQALPAPPLEHADIDRRRSYLRVCQGRPREGHGCAHRAVESYKKSDDLLDRHHLGLALIARGFTHYKNSRLGASAVDLSAAIGMINYRTKPRTYYYALHNLTVIMVETMAPERLGQTLKNLDASYKRFVGYSQRHIAKYKIRWLQALAQKRFGATRQAEIYFKKAFNGFVELGAASEVALISLDIGILYVEEGRLGEAKALAGHAYKIVTALGMPSGAIAALALWNQASEAELTTGFLKSIRATVAEHAQPFGAD